MRTLVPEILANTLKTQMTFSLKIYFKFLRIVRGMKYQFLCPFSVYSNEGIHQMTKAQSAPEVLFGQCFK